MQNNFLTNVQSSFRAHKSATTSICEDLSAQRPGVSGGGREPSSETENLRRSETSQKNAPTPRRPLHALLDGTVITESSPSPEPGSGADSRRAAPPQPSLLSVTTSFSQARYSTELRRRRGQGANYQTDALDLPRAGLPARQRTHFLRPHRQSLLAHLLAGNSSWRARLIDHNSRTHNDYAKKFSLLQTRSV